MGGLTWRDALPLLWTPQALVLLAALALAVGACVHASIAPEVVCECVEVER